MYLETKSLEKISKETVTKLCRAYTGVTRQDCEDAVQNAFLTALEKFGNLDSVNESWLYITSRCRLLDKLRRDKRSIHQVPEQLLEAVGPTLVDIALDSEREDIKAAATKLAYPDNN